MQTKVLLTENKLNCSLTIKVHIINNFKTNFLSSKRRFIQNQAFRKMFGMKLLNCLLRNKTSLQINKRKMTNECNRESFLKSLEVRRQVEIPTIKSTFSTFHATLMVLSTIPDNEKKVGAQSPKILSLVERMNRGNLMELKIQTRLRMSPLKVQVLKISQIQLILSAASKRRRYSLNSEKSQE